MKRLVLVLVCLLAAAAANADWGGPIKWDQMSNGLDNWGAASWLDGDVGSAITADDFLCTDLNPIADIHFAGWASNSAALQGFRVTFWTDVPADPNDESHPGYLLYDHILGPANAADPLKLGYQDMGDGTWRIDLPKDMWFLQEGAAANPTVYWMGIQAVFPQDGVADSFYWNFVDRKVPTWGDDAAFASEYYGYDPWHNWGWGSEDPGVSPELYNGPFPTNLWKSADMAFELSTVPEPSTIMLMVGILSPLVLLRRRK